MDTNFWLHRWEKNDIGGFHEPEANPMLVKYFHKLPLKKGGRIFLPLCGKTLDIAWLLSKGYRVAGAELSPLAIDQLFKGLGVKPKVSSVGPIQHCSADSIDIFLGDIFAVSQELLDDIDVVYDRAALVALAADVRPQYTKHLMDITQQAPQLLISYEYDQSVMEGPPFSVSHGEVKQHYQNCYHLTVLESKNVPGGLKGKCIAQENIWLLRKREKIRT